LRAIASVRSVGGGHSRALYSLFEAGDADLVGEHLILSPSAERPLPISGVLEPLSKG
jgi:hypothetical protein